MKTARTPSVFLVGKLPVEILKIIEPFLVEVKKYARYYCKRGMLEALLWCRKYNYPLYYDNFSMNFAVANGHLHVVKFIHKNRSEGCNVWGMNYAAENGHLEVVKFLHYNRTEGCTIYAASQAMINGHLHVVKFLLENRSEGYTTNAAIRAAKNGHQNVVEFIHSI